MEVDEKVKLLEVFFIAEKAIRGLVRSRGLGDDYKRQAYMRKLISNEIKQPIRE